MTPILILYSSLAYVELPKGWIGWIGFILLISLIAILLWNWRGYNDLSERRQRFLFILLAICAPLAGLFIGVALPPGQTLPPPETAVETTGPVIMVFAAIPFVLAGGMLGPLPAALLAALASLPLTLYSTHNIFTLLEFALLAVLFSAAVRQRYRTRVFHLLRNPLFTAFLLVVIYPILHLLVIPFSTRGYLVSRLDYALSNIPGATLALAIQLLVASILAEIIRLTLPSYWGESGDLLPSPAERSLLTRFITTMAPLAVLLVIALIASDWYAAGYAAREMLRARMETSASVAAESIPYFLEAGQSLITQLSSDTRLLSGDSETIAEALPQMIKVVPFFTRLMLIDNAGKLIGSYPSGFTENSPEGVIILNAVEQAVNGVPFQTFTLPPLEKEKTAQSCFMATIFDNSNVSQRMLLGCSPLDANPFSKSILASLNSLEKDSGQGILLDENGRILVHENPDQVWSTYMGRMSDQSDFDEVVAADGTRSLVFFQRSSGRPWSVVMSVPARRAQQIALDISTPILAVILILAALGLIISRMTLRVITASLKNLTSEAGRLAQGHLERPLMGNGVDETGMLRNAFEKMRFSLKSRLDELNQLLFVSQGVASSLEMSEAVQPILESSLTSGASVARVVLTPSVVPELDGGSEAPISYELGVSQDYYRDLDEQILAFTRQQDRLVLPNVTRPRLLTFPPGTVHPQSIFAVALRHENTYYGCFWTAYDEPHNFTEEEVRFLVVLGSQAAMAAANSRLFQNAEIGRQRLAAILASSPDPVLVTDQRDCLLLANPAAFQVLGLGLDTDEGQPIDQVIPQDELIELLTISSGERFSKEILLPDGRVYLATATSVLAEGQRVGRVCVLRDVTHFKELDAMKSDFVSTVSHDLRSPLTLMRGYATMLDMVGQLNEQQVNYVKKIVIGVESMSRLVNNLLDLGRIEAGVGLKLEMIPAYDVVERVIGALQLQATQKSIRLTTEIPRETIPLIEADLALLQQALHNLVENAIKYTRPDGRVHLRVRVLPNDMVFEVIDNGIGISPMDQPRLFEKFYRGAQLGAKDQGGTGLGLAIVKSIADRHGGRVEAESQLGKGSIFRFSVPLKQPKYERRAPEAVAQQT